jgi:HD-GYP domain-containing protein (c-di-GMP phosphodiesterase class II)
MRLVNLDQLTVGTRLAQPLFGKRGRLLLAKGVALTHRYLTLLHHIGLPAVYVLDDDTSDIDSPDPIAPETRAKTLSNLADAFEQVAKAGETLRQVPPELLRKHLEEDKFVKTLAADGAGEALSSLGNDIDALVNGLQGHDVLTGLNSIKTHDQYTFMHSLDVTIMGLVLANAAGWEGTKLKSFGTGCLLHDLGKILIDPALLNKTGPLTPDEFEILKGHPSTGYEIIRAIAPRLGSLVPLVAHQHHERQDGSGYPRGIKGNEHLATNEPGRIHDFGAVCAVADIYDAMISHRPYRRARPADEVVNTIAKYSGRHLNAQAVKIFLATVTPFPICSAVKVKNGKYAGHEGIVSDVNKHNFQKPKVRLLYSPDRTRIDPTEIDLSIDQDIEIESVRDEKSQLDSLGSPSHQPEPKTRAYAVPKAVLAALKQAS